jgi:hypothetical protein
MSKQSVSICMLVAAICAMGPLRADDEPSPEERAASQALLTKAMQSFTIACDDDRTKKLEFNESPVLRYSDPVSTSNLYAKISDGVVFVWTRQGYPEAITAVHNSNTGRLWLEFLSLSPTPLTALRQEQAVWYSKKSGMEFQPVKDAPVPDEDAPKRLSQMRRIVQSFSATVSDRDIANQELRLLSKPIVRYSKAEQGIIDGAVFVFARSTNPEMLLLLEARELEGKRQWMYSPARFTGRGAELRYENKPIWSHEQVEGARDPMNPFFQIGLPLEDVQ